MLDDPLNLFNGKSTTKKAGGINGFSCTKSNYHCGDSHQEGKCTDLRSTKRQHQAYKGPILPTKIDVQTRSEVISKCKHQQVCD